MSTARRLVAFPWIIALLGAVAFTFLTAPLSAADDWPQFRGPNCSGVAASTKPLPAKFSSKENVLWSAQLGDGISSPVVAAGRAFGTAIVGEKPAERQFIVYCLDAATGKELWRKAR